jgi:hypothetical protein
LWITPGDVPVVKWTITLPGSPPVDIPDFPELARLSASL